MKPLPLHGSAPSHGNVVMMQFERRLVSLLVLLALTGAPALGLRLLCAGHSCDQPVSSTATIPFCSLPAELRELVANGSREGRSPGVLAVASRPVRGGTAFSPKDVQPEWPSVAAIASTRVPIAFGGVGISAAGDEAIPGGTGLDDVAPTIAELMHLQRPHPEVRSGRALAGVGGNQAFPLTLQIVWKGVGSDDLEAQPEAWPTARRLVDGFGTMDGRTRSLPADPAAVLTTIGTGGTPEQHGITGTLIRDDSGRLHRAWTKNAPISVIAGLGDDLDEVTDQRARVGMVADAATDRGLVGGTWYVAHDDDELAVSQRPNEIVREVELLLEDGYGGDDVPDLLAVTLRGAIHKMDRVTKRLIDASVAAVGSDRLAIAFTSTGSVSGAGLSAARVTSQVEEALSAGDGVVAASAPGGLYLDQATIAQEEIADDDILTALRRVEDRGGRRVFRDVFAAIAVSFGRYC